jgi:signal transduction histidine kinase
MWHWLNRPVDISAHAIRVACTVLLATYGVVAILRFDASHAGLAALRGTVCAWALLGIVVAPRLTSNWKLHRAYTLVLVVLLPLVSTFVVAALGNRLSELPLVALATFIPLVFVLSALDLVIAASILLVVDATIQTFLPSAETTFRTMMIVLGGTIMCGAATALMLIFYRTSLQESLARLERALQAKSEFLNTMSHELRSPLHVIIGYTDLLREGDAGLSDEFVAQRVRASALELLQLVENTMNVARLDAGRARVRLEEFAPETALAELADGIRALPEAQAGVAVEWSVVPGLPIVRLDRLKLKEIVQNLISNALKFTLAGRVTVRVDQERAWLRIAVRDTGVGIAAEAQSRIFELFERIEAPDGHRPGVGLGLYIVKSLVQLMEGTIELESRPGAGSCFTVRLPLRLGEPAAARPTAAPPPMRLVPAA